MNSIDKLNDLNRFGSTENEIIVVYNEALNFSKKIAAPSLSFSFEKVENFGLAGHVMELVSTKDGILL